MSLSPRLIGLLTVPPLLWAGNAVVGRLIVPYVPPLALNAIRWGITILLLLALGWRALATAERRRDVRQRWGYLALVGLFGTGAYNALQYLALVTSTPINVTLIGASMPLWMLIVGAMFFGEKPRWRQGMGAMFSLAGVAVVLARGQPQELLNIRLVPGDMLMLLASLCWSAYSWLLVRPPASMQGERRPQIVENGVARPWNWAEFLLVQALFGLGWATLAAGGEALLAPREIIWTPMVIAALAYLVVGPSLISYWFWGEGVKLGGPQLGAFFTNLIPLFAAVLSTLLLGEAPHWYHGLAFALIVAGIAVSAKR